MTTIEGQRAGAADNSGLSRGDSGRLANFDIVNDIGEPAPGFPLHYVSDPMIDSLAEA